MFSVMASDLQSPFAEATQEKTMTQLNLSGRESTDAKQKSPKESEGTSIKDQTVGALGALAMFAAVIVVGSCSRSNTPVATQQSTQPTAPATAPVATVQSPVPTPVAAKAKPKSKRAKTLSYVNREYGVGFSFPREYSLKSGDQAQLSWGYLGPFQQDFVQPGGVTVAAVELPKTAYPGTDFDSAFLALSVNPEITPEQCTQFAFPETKTAADPSATDAVAKNSAEKVKIGAIEFTKVVDSRAAMMKQADAKYFHAFKNGACYEFALGLGTEGDGNVEETAPVDRQAVFSKLEKILASVKFQPVSIGEGQPLSPSARERAPENSSNTQAQNAIDHKEKE
jgi:hypothetical protein